MAYKLTLMICTLTGRGDPKKRAFSGVIAVPPANWVRRKAPSAIGMALSMINPTGTSYAAEAFLAGALGFGGVGFPNLLGCDTSAA